MKLLQKLLLLVVFVSSSVNAQLADFNLQVYKTNETCLGNGSLTFAVTGLTPQATLLYKVFRLPETDNPIAILATGNMVSSLSAGTYRVIAIQALGSYSNSKQQDVTIDNAIADFAIDVVSANQNCSDGGTITVKTLSGTPASYEIMSGPVTRPLQASNIFPGLPSGTYNIRAFDICGMGKVKTFTLSVVNTTLSISGPIYTDATCNSYNVVNKITPSAGAIGYPLTVKHTLLPMNMSGESVIINQSFATGPADELAVSAVMPRYLTESYTYELEVVDNCNVTYNKTDNEVNPEINLSLGMGDVPCGKKFLTITPSLHTAPYTITFDSFPAGFVAADFNSNAGQPFYDDTINFGNEQLPVPFGTYVVTVTDACRRSKTETLAVEFVPPVPSARGTNNGCFSLFGRIRISVPQNQVVTATIIEAPAEYTATNVLPKNITGNISNGTVVLNNMPLGVYKIAYTDDCGNSFESEVEVPPFVERPFNIAALPDCAVGFGTVRLRSGNGKLVSAQIIAAPSNYSGATDVTSIIDAAGNLYMNNLPQGTYTFRAVDVCGITHDMPINVEGYIAPQNPFTYTPGCAAFSVRIADNGNGLEGAAFYLQKRNAAGQWGHPATGAVYEEGADPSAATGVRLSNNTTRNNLNYSGEFRIVKRFESFGNGTAQNSVCVSILGGFTYTDGLSISNAYSLACIGEPNTVYIEALGYPTAYRIIKKNNNPFVVQNGTNKIFSNLEPADYVFQVEDACGNIITKSVSVQMLPSITEASQPTDMVACTELGSAGGNQEFYLKGQDAAVLGSLPSAMYTITYHATQADADNGVNALPEYYTNYINGQWIYARLVHNEIALCHGTTSFKLLLGKTPEASIITEGVICDGGSVSLTAPAGFNNYVWSNGQSGPNMRTITVNQPGIYTLTVHRNYGDQYCPSATVQVEIKASYTPVITDIDSKDWSSHENSITVHAQAQGQGKILYSVDGSTFQESNVFTGLEPGMYNVHVKDEFGCGLATKEVALLHYPNFFTPNGDGYNDKWQIKYSILEPHLKVTIFDRYGKLITSFGSTSEGWDGTMNKQNLPSTDYWFVVVREDGREYKGHFSMIR